ncbi:GGDEF domain-containing protein [uncultured Deefgea sp.]|uniref:GGDEF domain-containing protein n=1 Tax=uncultured Deefgea sp. TaxID=1304914 RepID=UPI002622E92D|nr:GGDEF domain-containing protein [uncultured Deefgea sp.]
MRQTDQTLLEQMRITEFDISHRKELVTLSSEDIHLLLNFKESVIANLDHLVSRFYDLQTNIPEIALLIGDLDTLDRLRNAQRKYILDLFSGVYNLDYVNNRLRIGLVHKRIGVEPKLYLSGIYTLKQLLLELIFTAPIEHEAERNKIALALEKLFMFDITLVFETYIRSLVAEIESSKNKSEEYARSLEDKVRERTQQLEEMIRTDPLTGLLNVRDLHETLTRMLRAAERRAESVAVVYIDVNDFKLINDVHGHTKGDEVLRYVARSIKQISRSDDYCFRYGGDEFCILMSRCNKVEAEAVYLRRLFEEMYQSEDCVSLSIGCAATGPEHYISAIELIEQADQQMYVMKNIYKESKQLAQSLSNEPTTK